MLMQGELDLEKSMDLKQSGLNICSKNLSNQLKYSKLDLELEDQDQDEMDQQAMDDIDKALEEQDENAMSSSVGFNKTFKGAMSG